VAIAAFGGAAQTLNALRNRQLAEHRYWKAMERMVRPVVLRQYDRVILSAISF
jgi:hypothetical protein